MAKKLLLSINFFPNFLPPQTGGEQRSFHVLKALAEEFDVISVVPTYENMRYETVSLAPGLTEIRIPKSKAFSTVSGDVGKRNPQAHRTALAYAIAGASQPEMLMQLRRLWPEVDGVILQHASAVAVLDAINLEPKPTFYISHNCEFELAANAHINSTEHELALLMHQFEYRACQASSLVVGVTEEDREKFIGLYGTRRENSTVAGNGSVCRFPEGQIPEAIVDPASAIFLGSKWGPNLTAARFITEQLAPACPEVTFHICGSVCDDSSVQKAPANVVLHGMIDDKALGDLMARTHVGLNPIMDGAGSNVKLADYLAHGLRVLSTPKGLRGFDTGLENVLGAEAKDLAAVLSELATLPAPDQKLRQSWQNQAASYWSWTMIGAELTERVKATFENTASPTPTKRILVLNEFPITGRTSGGEARIGGLLSEVPPNTEVSIVTFGRENFAIHQIAERVSCIELPATEAQKLAVAAENRYSYTSADDVIYPATVHHNPMFLMAVETMVANCDAVVLEHPFMWEVYRQVRSRAPVIFGSHNVEADMKLVTLDSHRNKHQLCEQIRIWEQEVTRHADLICACSQGDADVYRSWGGKRVEVLENGVTPLEQQLSTEPFEDERKVWLRHEFEGLNDANLIHLRLLGRIPTESESEAAQKAIKTGGETLDHYLLQIMRSPENLAGKRSYITGLLSKKAERPFSAVFLGTSHRPNLTAAELLIDYVAPNCPDTDFLLLGKVGVSLQQRDLPKNVFITGFVSDSLKTAVMLDCDLGLNPMTEGGGSNLKVPDYMVHGLEVVSTFFGGRGFGFSPEDGLHLSEIIAFPEVINRLSKARQPRKARASGKRVSPKLEAYYWTTLSRRYFQLIAEAAGFDRDRQAVALESDAFLDETALCLETTPLRSANMADKSELLVQAQPMLIGGEEPRYQDLGLRRARFFETRRETSFLSRGMNTFGLFNRRTLRLGGGQKPVAEVTLPSEAVKFAKGFSIPYYNGRRGHRFLRSGAVLVLPKNVTWMLLRGYTAHNTSLILEKDGQVLLRQDTHKNFTLELNLPDATTEITIRKVGSQALDGFDVSIEELSIVCDEVRSKVPVLSPDAGRGSSVVDGYVHDRELQDESLGTIMGGFLRMSTGGYNLEACGSDSFINRMSAILPGVAEYSGTGPLIEDWMIGLMANGRNRVGYRNKLGLGPRPLVIVADRISSELVNIVETAFNRLSKRFPEMKIAVVLPRSHTREQRFETWFKDKGIPLKCFAAESEREMLGVMTDAGLVLGYRLPVYRTRKLAIFARVFDLSLRFWSCDLDDDAADFSASGLEECINRFWARGHLEHWRPTGSYGAATLPKSGAKS